VNSQYIEDYLKYYFFENISNRYIVQLQLNPARVHMLIHRAFMHYNLLT